MSRTVIPFTSRTDTRPVPAGRVRERAVYTVREVAALLSLSLGSTYALVRNGEIPAIKLGGRWVIPKKRFHDWLDSAAVPATDDPHGWA